MLRRTAFSLLALFATAAFAQPINWKTIQNGVELATIAPGPLYVVRIDPQRATVTAGVASQSGAAEMTAAAWCQRAKLSVAINLGMYANDHSTHTGYLRSGKHVNNAKWNDYRSVLAFAPRKVRWLDLEQGEHPALDDFDVVVQNLRLIAAPRKNVWSQSDRRWSEAALAIDSKGRLLFLFSRAPYSMRDFNAHILALPLDIQQAMHVEGGPEASLSVHAGGVDLDLCGSYETGFMPNDNNHEQWPIPNVLGVLRENAH